MSKHDHRETIGRALLAAADPLNPAQPLPASAAGAAEPSVPGTHGGVPRCADPSENPAPDIDAVDYNLADYRWVPVRRVPRRDGWTEEKQRRFIEVLADTGLVSLAAKAVGMSRESAYRLRRSPHGAAFARAWDAARQHAGGLIEDIAFERAIEGVEHEVYNHCGEVIGARLVHDNRLLRYLLSHLKPERYGRRSVEGAPAAPPAPAAAPSVSADPPTALEESLRAMEPALPAPPEQLLAPEDLADELQLAEICDGALPQFLREQRPPKTDAQIAAEQAAARDARGAEAWVKQQAKVPLSEEEFADLCFHLDPISNAGRRRRPR